MSLPPLSPGATIGILGGGQLGRMLALAAAQLGLRCHVYCPDEASPAFEVAHAHTCAAYEDEASLAAFVSGVDRVTFEFENVPHVTAAYLEAHVPVLPCVHALATTQDRLTEKTFLQDLGIETAPFAAVDDLASLEQAVARIGLPSVLKTRRFGYDGKGQVMLRPGCDLAAAWKDLGEQPAILEGFVPFELECSVVVARSHSGEIAAYDIVENHHEHHILKTSTVPANVTPTTASAAGDLGRKVAEALDYVGVLAIELFLARDEKGERLLANEIAPRVHNSGHWTQDGCVVSQFEQHIRAVAGWPLGSPVRHSNVVMTNLIGDDVNDWPRYAASADTAIHLYGKAKARPGRKMGHVNHISPKT